MTECANCRSVTDCSDDGEAYVCVDTAACRLRQVYDLMDRAQRAEQERDVLRGQLGDTQYSLDLCRITQQVAREDAEKNARSARTAWKMQQQSEQERDTLKALLSEAVAPGSILDPESSTSTCRWCGSDWGTRYDRTDMANIREYTIPEQHEAGCFVMRVRAVLHEGGMNTDDDLQALGDVQSHIWNARERLGSLPRQQEPEARQAIQRAIDYLTNAREALHCVRELTDRQEAV